MIGWAAAKLFFGGVINRAIEALSALFRLALRWPWQTALIAALCLAGWQWRAANAERAKVSDLTAVLVSERAAYAAAMAEAERLHREARADNEKLSKDIAHATDERATLIDADSRRNLAERVRKAPKCSSGATVTAALPDNPGGDIGADTGGVSFTLAEADALRRHEVRSTSCNGWALDLIAAGLALPAK